MIPESSDDNAPSENQNSERGSQHNTEAEVTNIKKATDTSEKKAGIDEIRKSTAPSDPSIKEEPDEKGRTEKTPPPVYDEDKEKSNFGLAMDLTDGQTHSTKELTDQQDKLGEQNSDNIKPQDKDSDNKQDAQPKVASTASSDKDTASKQDNINPDAKKPPKSDSQKNEEKSIANETEKTKSSEDTAEKKEPQPTKSSDPSVKMNQQIKLPKDTEDTVKLSIEAGQIETTVKSIVNAKTGDRLAVNERLEGLRIMVKNECIAYGEIIKIGSIWGIRVREIY